MILDFGTRSLHDGRIRGTQGAANEMTNLRRFNLNLLVMLDALLQTRSVTLAGERLGLTQPAASAALAKLREAFEDELLVMVGRELRPTPKAERLMTPLRDLLQSTEALFAADQFAPSRWDGEFVIATADYMSAVLLPHLLDVTTAEAPDLTIRFTNLTSDTALNLKLDKIDMIIAPMALIRDPMLMSRQIFSDRWVCAYRSDGRFAREGISLETYLAGTHACSLIDRIEYSGTNNTSVPEVDGLRAQQRNAVLLPFYTALPFIVANSSLFTLVQERLVQSLGAGLPLTTCEPPVPLPQMDYAMFWSPRMSRDPAHQWIRQTIAAVAHRHFHK